MIQADQVGLKTLEVKVCRSVFALGVAVLTLQA